MKYQAITDLLNFPRQISPIEYYCYGCSELIWGQNCQLLIPVFYFNYWCGASFLAYQDSFPGLWITYGNFKLVVEDENLETLSRPFSGRGNYHLKLPLFWKTVNESMLSDSNRTFLARSAPSKGGVTLVDLQRRFKMIRCCTNNRSGVTSGCRRIFLRSLQCYNALQVFESDSKTCNKCNMSANSCENMRCELALQIDQCNTT